MSADNKNQYLTNCATLPVVVLALLLITLFQVTSIWFYHGDKVDESELVHFAVGFLGGDLDPVWDGYGHLGMYLLGLVYFLLGIIPVAVGKFDSFVDYGTQLLSNGYFFIVARFIFAAIATLAVLALAKLSFRQGMPLWMCVAFIVFMASLPMTIYYSNYIRTDTLVMFFSVLSITVAMSANNMRSSVLLAATIATAVACKISALSLSALLLLVLLVLVKQKRCTRKDAFFVSVLFLLFLQLFQPFISFPHRLNELVARHYLDTEVSIARDTYASMVELVSEIVKFHIKAIGLPLFVLAVLSPIGFFTHYRKLVTYSWLVVILLILPYIPGSTVRDYWFIPSYFILALMGFVSVAVFFEFVSRKLPAIAKSIVALMLVSLLVYFPVSSALDSYSNLLTRQRASTASNSDTAKAWLEHNYLRKTPILLDGHFRHIYPKIYDPAQLELSREISRLYIYERGSNKFLAAVLEKYLYSDYVQQEFFTVNPYVGLQGIRIDLDPKATFLALPVICSSFSDLCREVEFVRSKDIKNFKSSSSGYSFEVVGNDPYLVFKLPFLISTDGSFFAKISCNGEGGHLLFDFGEGFNPNDSQIFHGCEATEVRISDKPEQPWVNLLRSGQDPNEIIERPGAKLFVTSPSGYSRFKRISAESKDQSRVARAIPFNQHYNDLLNNKLIKVFDDASSPTMEIYEIPGPDQP